MSEHILKGFISRLDFISKRINHTYNNDFEIIILNRDNESNKIKGTVSIKLGNEESEVISYEIQISQSEDMLIFRSKYQNTSNHTDDKKEVKLLEEVNTFVIVNQESKSFFTPKTKYLIHLVDGNIKQAYVVNKKYKFENGISENHSKLNMDNKDVVNSINCSYITQNKRR